MSIISIKSQQTGITSGDHQLDFLLLKSRPTMKYLMLFA